MLNLVALMMVLLAGGYLLLLAVCAFAIPGRTQAFLLAFASSARVHRVELLVRLMVGAAFIQRAPAMTFPHVFKAFGWLLLATTVIMALLPWRLHRRFAEAAVPHAIGRLWMLAIGSGALGTFVLACAMQ